MFSLNTHFAIATHVLTALALHDEPVTSALLADSVQTNPAFLRTVIGRLTEAGLVQTRRGAGGGALLARPARSITLLDVFRATEGHLQVPRHDCSGAECAVADAVPTALADLERRLDAAAATELSATTIADIAGQVVLDH